ncbi:major facilitator superfamily domain-containing protein [Hyaloscypha finlandica]|nr:major facilitator superfamily domain-containing protein [Hyaloscypha finlandica]
MASPEKAAEPEIVTQSTEPALEHEQNAAVEQANTPTEIPHEVHSIFSPNNKKFIILTASTAAFFSPLSSNIYLPALNLLARDLHVSDSKINLTVTTYLIFQAISPLMIAGFSDNSGRRPAYIICFILYIAANIGLALQKQLFADIATSAERGKYVAYSSVSTILGPTLSPIIGGLLSQYLGWKAIFWFLTIFAVPVFILLMFFLPETCHKIVGNGSIPPTHFLNKSVMSYLIERKLAKEGTPIDLALQEALAKNMNWKFPNPLATLVVLFNKEAAFLMLYIGLLLAVHYLILTGIPSIYAASYNLNEIQIALVYIPYGFGSVVSAFTTGKLVDWNYRRHAKRLDFPLVLNRKLDLSDFPIERARLEVALPLLYFGSALIIVYGWLLTLNVSLAGPLILLFFIGWCIFATYQVTAILVVDIYPDNPATATAANNLIRCLFSAGSTAVCVLMLQGIGRGWTYTLAALLFVALSPMLWVLIKFGPGWRRVMKESKENKETSGDLDHTVELRDLSTSRNNDETITLETK